MEKNKIRILIIDKDVLARQAIANVLQHESVLDVRVSGDVQNVEKTVRDLNPEVVLLNLEDAGSESLSVLRSLKVHYPGLPVIILAPRTEEGARVAIAALRNGALDIITKPEQSSSMLFAGRHLKKRLLPAVKAALQLSAKERSDRLVPSFFKGGPQQNLDEISGRFKKLAEWPVSIITMGACIGGPDALFSILPGLPADLSVPVVIAQHFPKIYTRELARSLNKVSRVPVREATNRVELTPGTIWLAPGGYHCEIQQEGIKPVLNLHRGPRENGVRPSIDILFRSAGKFYGPGVLGVILSGCESDGLAGAKFVRDNDGEVIVQDPKTALASVLPLYIIKAGLANNWFAPEQISSHMYKRSKGTLKNRKIQVGKDFNYTYINAFRRSLISSGTA